ncbi:hypothetical protein D3C86_1341720 [compost metagenome]
MAYRKHGPARPKYQYEIEKELGIEPPDLEGIWRLNQEELAHRQYLEQLYREQQELANQQPVRIIYHINPTVKPTEEEEKRQDDTEK